MTQRTLRRTFAACLASVTILTLAPGTAQEKWNPVSVNHPKGVACAQLFSGAQGVCWPLGESIELLRLVGTALPSAEKETSDLKRALDEAKAAIQDRKVEVAQLREAISHLTAQKDALQKALDASERRAEVLQKASTGSGWQMLLSFVGGGITCAGITWGVRR